MIDSQHQVLYNGYSHDYSHFGGAMKTVSKSVLKSKMLAYFRKIEESGEPLIVTDHQNPVLKILPFQDKNNFDQAFGDLKGKIKYSEPLDTPTIDEWGDI